jgi:AcrR family transcriptional regulator
MKQRIKDVAVEMLIAHGCAGFRFQQIAEALQCTRGNIHYHYRHKHILIEEVTIEYCERTIRRFHEIWYADVSLSEKIQRSMEFNQLRYLMRNPSGDTSYPWSLIARMRLERDLITEPARAILKEYSTQLQLCVTKGVRQAVEQGELKPDTLIEVVALPFIELANSADPITRDAGEFDRLRQMYSAFDRLVSDAYGQKP